LAHIPRKELKTDEVRETFVHGAEAIRSHQQISIVLLIAVIIVALGVLGWRLHTERQDVKSAALYDAAMASFSGRVIAPGQPPAEAGEITFPDDTSKYTDAATKFAAVAATYPHTQDGVLARYFGGISYEHIGKDDDAKRLLQQLSSDSNSNFSPMGTFELAQIDDRTGQGDQAAKLYQ
jgi:predicted negative regulator of RcsB-dependent stress response